jgi:hypothetical protein
MRVLAPEDAERVYRLLEPNYPYGKKCPRCGGYHPIREHRLRCEEKYKHGYALMPYCKECTRTVDRENHRKRQARLDENKAVYAQDAPEPIIPSLKVGKRYVITDTGRTWIGMFGGDSHKPVHYVGPCVARWGRNWGIRTSTGIRCFTPGTLVGLDVREVGKSA